MHSKNINEVLNSLNTNLENGLTNEEVKARLLKYGENKLNEKKKAGFFVRLLHQFKDVMIIILIIASIISFTIAIIEGDTKEFFEPVLILLIVIANAIMGVTQEAKAQKALDALKNMSTPSAEVFRNGTRQMVNSRQLVPGDIILLDAGDFVPADARLIKSANLKCEESALTGESVPAEKSAKGIMEENCALADMKNMVFSGCSVTYGTATAVVVNTGMNTEIGKIANLISNEKNNKTPLQNKLAKLGKYLGLIALGACAIIFLVGLINGIDVLDIFMISVSLAVSAIPEGLPAIVTIVLALGVQKMAKKNAIIKRLPAVETLGNASVICSDKTGTLTQNKMTLVKAWADGEKEIEDITNENSENIKKLLTYGTLCSDGAVKIKGDKEELIGDPTETAIIIGALKNNILKSKLNKLYPRQAEIPFDSDRKLMTTINLINDKYVVIVKGAFDVLEKRCNVGNLKKAKLINKQMSENALRVIAVAYKEIESIDEISTEKLENDLTFMGIVGMIDPPREEAKDAVEVCLMAGIKPVMITGDHIVTACAIAKELGIYKDGDMAITGQELDELTDEQLDQKVNKISVYARVSPENKIRIVKAWQKRGEIVAMTGDGVNDAPALKASDIGCAMGITGTDVAKGAADITLTDDNFATIVDAVKEGRGIYANIKKVVAFLLGTNIGEVFTVFIAMMLWHITPLLSMQLLWINLVTDSLPAVALGVEKTDKDVMKQKPRPKNEGIFAGGLGFRVVLHGLIFAVITLIGFKVGQNATGLVEAGRTMAFMTLALSQVIQAYNVRSSKSIFKNIFTNKTLNIATLLSILLIAILLFTPLNSIFGLVILPYYLYFIALSLIIVPTIIMELTKLFKK